MKAIGKRKRLVTTWLPVIGVTCLLMSSSSTARISAQAGSGNDSKRVKIVGGGVEFIEISPSAPQCPAKQKGETIRPRVTSETPVDVRLYIQTGWHQWMNKDFSNQKRGDEITNYRCDQKPSYKIFSRAVGSSEAWPKP